METERNYIICATHRSGSNLLGDLLRSTRVAGDPQELCSPRLMGKFALLHEVGVWPEQQFVQYFRSVQARLRATNGVFGIKVMWSHLGPLFGLLKKDADYRGDISGDFSRMFDWLLPNAKFIWISRQDKVRQAISMVRAKLTDVFSAQQEVEGLNKLSHLPEYDYSAIKSEVRRIISRNAAWGEFFHSAEVRPLRVVYEELCADPQRELGRVMRYLGLDETVFSSATIRERQADLLNEQWYVRFNEDSDAERLSANENREQKPRWWRR